MKYFKITFVTLIIFVVGIHSANAALWTPNQISINTWYDASDVTTITSSSSAVSQWRDKIGTNHLNQTTASLKPIYGTRNINGLSTVAFDGVNDIMNLTTTIGLALGTQTTKREVWAIVKMDDTTNETILGNSSATIGVVSIQSNKLRLDGGFLGPYSGDSLSPAIDTDPSILGFIADSNKSYSINGTFSTTTDTLGGASNNRISVNRVGFRTGAPFSGIMGEIIVTTGISSINTRQKIEGYLAWKWGLQDNLPSDHPYKYSAPMIYVPSEPQSVSATAGNSTSTVTWLAPSSDGGSNITSYNLYENNVLVSTTSSSTFSFSRTNLTNGNSYSYYVTAVNTVGESASSSVTTVIPALIPDAPDVPTFSNISFSTLTVNFIAPNNGGSNITNMSLYRVNEGSTTTLSTSLSSSTTLYDDTGLIPNTLYSYFLTATNAAGTSTDSILNSTTTLPWSAPKLIYLAPPTEIIYGCKDTKALNYNYFSASNPSLCVYNTITASSSKLIFTRDLKFGMSGNDVKELQNYIVAKKIGPAAIALQRNGLTNYFGNLTKKALVEFQKAYKITPNSGYFGPKTKLFFILNMH